MADAFMIAVCGVQPQPQDVDQPGFAVQEPYGIGEGVAVGGIRLHGGPT